MDSFKGWGKGSGDVLVEAIQRLKAIHPTARITISDEGFLRHTPSDFQNLLRSEIVGQLIRSEELLSFNLWNTPHLNQGQFWEKGVSEPLVLDVEWTQEVLGTLKKKVFFHPMNFNSSEHLSHLNRVIKPNSLGGIIVEGAPFPESIKDYLSQLRVHGSALLEVYSDDPKQLEVIEFLSSQSQFDIQLIHLETFIRYGVTQKTKGLAPKC